jgi:nucleoid-associated protein YgaU
MDMNLRVSPGKTGLWAAAVLGLSGCTMSMSGGPYGPPPSARRPMMAPTAGYYAPMGPQTVQGPVATVPVSTMTASTAAPTLAPTATGTIASAPLGPTPVATYYHVRQGDTLSAIATRYGKTVEEIRNANKINGNNDLAPGQMVLIPNAGTAIR